MFNGRPLHFLLVEDDDDHADLVLSSLQDARVLNTFSRVATGMDALAYVRAEGVYATATRPDVILLDLKLPMIDGHEVLATIKADPKLCGIPVVVLTTSAAEVDVVRAYQLNANSYLCKPVDFEKFQAMISDLKLYWCVWNVPPLIAA